MKNTVLGRLATLLPVIAVTLVAGAPAYAGGSHSLTGSMRFNIGSLPLPITGVPSPAGAIHQVPGATVMETGTQVVIAPSQFTFNSAMSRVIPLAPVNPAVPQVATDLSFQWPKSQATFKAGGRTGAATVHWCPGQTVTATGDPGCADPSAGGVIPGRLVYTKTVAQFGGAARGLVGGHANVALKAPGLALPCKFIGVATPNTACQVSFVQADPAATGVAGGAFNDFVSIASPALNPGKFHVNMTANGFISAITPTGLGAAAATNGGTSFGAPWTTGMINITQPSALGNPETFTITGADARAANGVGSLSLVAGYISTRATSGPNGNRGWLNMQIGTSPNVPMLPLYGVLTLAALTALSGAYKLRHRERA